MTLSLFNQNKYAKGFEPHNAFDISPEIHNAIQKISQNIYDLGITTGSVDLVDDVNIETDASLGSDFFVTLTDNRNMSAPTNPTAIKQIRYWITQDVTGSRTLTWDAAFRFSTGIPSPTLTTTPYFMDMVEFQYNSTFATWDCIRLVQGFDATPV